MPLFPITQLDANQVLKYAYDDALQALRTSATAVISATGDLAVEIDHTTDSIAIGTSAQLFTGTASGSSFGLDVNILGGTITGELNPVGLKNLFSSSGMIVGPTAVMLPSVSGQNSMSVRVWGANPVYFGNSSVAASITAAYPGYPKIQYEEIVIDLQKSASAPVYAVCDAGVSSELRFMFVG
jgi:hypothetical protein